jgi:hypothetical protein
MIDGGCFLLRLRDPFIVSKRSVAAKRQVALAFRPVTLVTARRVNSQCKPNPLPEAFRFYSVCRIAKPEMDGSLIKPENVSLRF